MQPMTRQVAKARMSRRGRRGPRLLHGGVSRSGRVSGEKLDFTGREAGTARVPNDGPRGGMVGARSPRGPRPRSSPVHILQSAPPPAVRRRRRHSPRRTRDSEAATGRWEVRPRLEPRPRPGRALFLERRPAQEVEERACKRSARIAGEKVGPDRVASRSDRDLRASDLAKKRSSVSRSMSLATSALEWARALSRSRRGGAFRAPSSRSRRASPERPCDQARSPSSPSSASSHVTRRKASACIPAVTRRRPAPRRDRCSRGTHPRSPWKDAPGDGLADARGPLPENHRAIPSRNQPGDPS